MKKKKILNKTFQIQNYSIAEELKEIDKEDMDFFLFLRGGLTAK